MNRETKRILIADSNPNVLRLIEVNLTRLGCQVETALDRETAWEMLRASRPDLLIVDVLQADMEGMKLARAVRADPDLATLPVLLMVARAADREDRKEEFVQESWADLGLSKPFSIQDLRDHVDWVLFGAAAGTTRPSWASMFAMLPPWTPTPAAGTTRPSWGRGSLMPRPRTLLMNRENRRILVVDDEPNIVRLVEARLADRGYSVDTARDGVAALSKLRASRFDLLVTDIMMPEMDGLELSRAIRADPDLAALPIVLMMAKSAAKPLQEAETEYIRESGADIGLFKPFSPMELCDNIDWLLFGAAEGVPRPVRRAYS